MQTIQVHLVTWLPYTVAEMVCYCEDNGDCYTIFLNANLSHERLIKAYHHAMSHIDNNDFESMLPVQEIEAIRHYERV